MNINKAIIAGRLTRDPELKVLPSGTNIASFSLATSRRFKGSDGQQREETEYLNIVVFDRQAETCAQYLVKGQVALVEGRIQTRSWDKDDGSKGYKTEIIAEYVQFGPKARGGDDDADQRPPAERAATRPKTTPSASGIEYPTEDINPDDIPF